MTVTDSPRQHKSQKGSVMDTSGPKFKLDDTQPLPAYDPDGVDGEMSDDGQVGQVNEDFKEKAGSSSTAPTLAETYLSRRRRMALGMVPDLHQGE